MTGAAGAHQQQIANAVKASGVVVRVEPEDFNRILERAEAPLVVHTFGGVFSKKHQYLTSYRGLAFFTKSPEPLYLGKGAEIVEATKIWIPE